MNRTELIYELARYMDPYAYPFVIYFEDAVLAAMLAYYRNINQSQMYVA